VSAGRSSGGVVGPSKTSLVLIHLAVGNMAGNWSQVELRPSVSGASQGGGLTLGRIQDLDVRGLIC